MYPVPPVTRMIGRWSTPSDVGIVLTLLRYGKRAGNRRRLCRGQFSGRA